MKLHVSVELPAERVQLCHGDHVMMLGSCFAEHVGRRMQDGGFRVEINPFGVLYNPASILEALKALSDGLPKDMYFESDEMWHSWLHAGHFSGPTLDDCRRLVEERYERACLSFRRLNRLYITWGTNRAYYMADGKFAGHVVANCHKMPHRLFVEQAMTPDEIVTQWTPMVERLMTEKPELRIVLTVSPYRYAKYGFHGSQLSKAALLLAADELCRRFAGACHYFPAYEIVTDELRDYRFYEADMLHPSTQAVDYVWERFSDWSFSGETREIIDEWEPLRRALAHRPFHPRTAAHSAFLQKIEQRVARLIEKYPNFAPSYGADGADPV